MRRYPIRLRLFLTYLFAILVPLGAVVLFLSLVFPRLYTDEVARRLHAEARLAGPVISEPLRRGAPPQELEALARRVAAEGGLRVTVVDRSGRVLVESDPDAALPGNPGSLPEFQAALRTGEGQAMRRDRTTGADTLYVARLLPEENAILRLATPLRLLDTARRTVHVVLLVSALAAPVLALALATMLGRFLTVPLAILQRRVQQLAQGDLEARVRPEGSLETRQLGVAFNRMAARMQEQIGREAEDRSRYETILAQMADGIVVTDPSGYVQMFNPAAGRLLEVSPVAALGRTLLEGTLHGGLWEVLERSLRERSAETREIRLRGARGRVLRVHAAPILGEAERLAGGVLVLQDLTETRRLEEMRRDFVANVSHELKSPVAAMRALAETLVLRGQDRPELAQEYAARISEEAERMTHLLADLLDLAAIESGRREWRREPLAVAPLLQGAAERFQQPAAAKGVALEWSAGPELSAWSDAAAVEQALANLVDNAVKYSPAGAAVTLSAARSAADSPRSTGAITVSRETPPWIVITVADTGPGIPPEALPRVFERFYRIDRGRARDQGGTGLGLAIARHLVEAQGGRIWVESAPGGGSRFSFTLPAQV
jgi:two-component system phosphate regulon sensor histidine kinase PhoR